MLGSSLLASRGVFPQYGLLTHGRDPGTGIGQRAGAELRAAEARFQRMQFPFPSKKSCQFLCCYLPCAPCDTCQCHPEGWNICATIRTFPANEADGGCPWPGA